MEPRGKKGCSLSEECDTSLDSLNDILTSESCKFFIKSLVRNFEELALNNNGFELDVVYDGYKVFYAEINLCHSLGIARSRLYPSFVQHFGHKASIVWDNARTIEECTDR